LQFVRNGVWSKATPRNPTAATHTLLWSTLGMRSEQ
jgi:hypothetical protein